MSGGKGGSTSSNSSSSGYNVSTTILPDWVTEASSGVLGKAQGLAAMQYQPYTGDIVADETADTQRAYQQIRDMQGMTNPAFNTAQGIYGGLTSGAQLLTTGQQNALTNQLYGNYGQNVISPTASLLSPYLGNARPATAQDVVQNQYALMSPYSQAVIDPALRIGQQQLAQNLQTIGAGANQAGAFGGSRQGVQEGVAQSQAALGAGKYVGDLLNNAWLNQLGTSYNLANQASQQGYNAANTLAGMFGTGYQQAGTQAGNIASTNLATGLKATEQIPALALEQAKQAQTDASLLATIGGQEQQQQQNELNAAYSQWYEAQNYPYQQLSTMLATLQGIPYGSQTSSYGQSYGNSSSQNNQGLSSTLSSALGGASAGAGLASTLGLTQGTGATAGALLGLI